MSHPLAFRHQLRTLRETRDTVNALFANAESLDALSHHEVRANAARARLAVPVLMLNASRCTNRVRSVTVFNRKSEEVVSVSFIPEVALSDVDFSRTVLGEQQTVAA